jgi:hypothetical protein
MKKAVAVVFVLVFAAAMVHYFYGEDHGAVRFPSGGGSFSRVHHHHGNTSTCLCFIYALAGPEADDWIRVSDFRMMLTPSGESRLRASLGADIAHPPRILLPV